MYGNSESHTHDASDVRGVADELHSHYDLESRVRGLREDLGQLQGLVQDIEARIGESELRAVLTQLERRFQAIEKHLHCSCE